MAMKTSWTSNVKDEQEKDELKNSFNAAARIRDRLTVMLKEKQDSMQKGSILSGKYDSPNWAYLQADSVGYQRALEEVIDLLKS